MAASVGKSPNENKADSPEPNIQETGISGGTTSHSNVAGRQVNQTIGPVFNLYNRGMATTGNPETDSKERIPEEKRGIQCPGRKDPCDALLSQENTFCSHCGLKINKTLFNTKGKFCKGRKNGSECNAALTKSKFCINCGTKKDSDALEEVRCSGVKHPCGSKLSMENTFCGECGWKVKMDLFSAGKKCMNLKSDGCPCFSKIMDDDNFCSHCGHRVSAVVSPGWHSMKQDMTISEKEQNIGKILSKWKFENLVNGYYYFRLMQPSPQLPLQNLHSIIDEKYKADFIEVSDGCLEFIFLHESKEFARGMFRDKDNVQRYIEKFLKELDDSVFPGSLEVTVTVTVQRTADHNDHDLCWESLETEFISGGDCRSDPDKS